MKKIGKLVSLAKSRITGDPGLWVTIFLCLYVCHRFYGSGFILHGDADHNLFYLQSFKNVDIGYDFRFRDSFPSLPLLGFYNPFILAISKAMGADIFPASYPSFLYVLMAAGAILFTSCGLLLRRIGREILIAPNALHLFVAISLFVGFQVIAIREFNLGYLFSFIGVLFTLSFTIDLILGKFSLRSFFNAVLAASLGLLSGTNVPFFYFFPAFVLLPFIYCRQLGYLLFFRLIGILLLALVAALILSAPVLLEGISSLDNTRRQNLEFGNGYRIEKFLISLFTRDWLDYKLPFFHERDVFWGGPVIVLCIHGYLVRRQEKGVQKLGATLARREVFETFFNSCAVISLFILFIEYLPDPIVDLISGFFIGQSIRNPMRFGMLLALPLAYYASVGAVNVGSLKRNLVFGIFVLNVSIYLIYLLISETQFTSLHIIDSIDSYLNFYICLIFQIFAYFLLFFGYYLKSSAIRIRLLSFSVVGYLIFSHNILTPYGPWFYKQGLGIMANEYFSVSPLRREFGLGLEYASSANYASERLTLAPYNLLTQGCRRVLDQANNMTTYSSGDTVFLLEKLYDPATNKYLGEIFENLDTDKLSYVFGVDCLVEPEGSEFLEPWHKFRKFALNVNLEASFGIRKLDNTGFSLISVPSTVLYVPDEREILGMLKKLSADEISRSVIIKGSHAAAQAQSSPTTHFIVLQLPNLDLKFNVATPMEGWILIKLPFHPNWHASINGVEKTLVRANHALMALQLNGESGDVTLRYDRGVMRELRNISHGLFLILLLILFSIYFKDRLCQIFSSKESRSKW